MSRWVHGESFNGCSEREVLVRVREVHERRVPVDDPFSDLIEERSLPVVVGVGRGGKEQLDGRVVVEGDVCRTPEGAVVCTVEHVHEVARVTVVPEPAEEAHGCRPLLDTPEEGPIVGCIDADADVDPCEVVLDSLSDLFRFVHVRHTDRDLPEAQAVESVGVASFREERFGFFWVVRVVLDIVVVAEHVRGHTVRGDVRGSLIEGDDRGLVDRVVDCLADSAVGERFFVSPCLLPGFVQVAFPVAVGVVVPVPVVQGEVPDAHAWSDEEAEVLVRLDVAEGGWVRSLHPLDGVVLQFTESCCRVSYDSEDEGVKPQWWSIPVLWVFGEGDVVVWEPFHELERSGAAGVLVRVRSPFLCVGGTDDRCRRHREAGEDRGVRVAEDDLDGVLAECLYFFDVGEEVVPVRPFPVLVVRVALVELAVEAKDDRGRVEGGAVVEGDVVPEEEGEDGAAPGDNPVYGEARLDQGESWLVGDEAFEDAVGACG